MTVDTYSLDKLRSTLIRLEDTIIFALIERAQFALNQCVYERGALEFNGATGEKSFLEYFFWETEKVHAKVRRYTSPDEYAFTSPLPDPILPPLQYDEFLYPNDINVNNRIMDIYIKDILPVICKKGDDMNYGSSATKDIEALQALSKRIHFGKFIAESKFRSNPSEYIKLALAEDREKIDKLLTNKQVEAKVLERLHRKALVYGQTLDEEQEGTSKHLRIPVELVVNLYKQWVIPLTKQVEVDYLIIRGKAAAAACQVPK
ncbi:chorismate mutase [Rhizopus microsporus var. microsporus]|uniref:Chorismate mutase n=2 Tax=Rhizopus microsporus TaxID=58291 RepID=A0A2G4SKI5_RHIZD|nr:chorismate mutase [Rhizopus microsporus ATCC 52813]ORE06286.1 chorismate mutase [Rhizopus microsporus var. microsporus]PHZ09281.1 chorismate mutase [Rhizopus microsporus ATCC 52813]